MLPVWINQTTNGFEAYSQRWRRCALGLIENMSIVSPFCVCEREAERARAPKCVHSAEYSVCLGLVVCDRVSLEGSQRAAG